MPRFTGLGALLLLAASSMFLAGCGGTGPAAPSGSPGPVTPSGSSPCRGRPAPRSYEHVILVVLENHSFAEVAGHSPSLNALSRGCGLATDYDAVSHPSLPNYLALTSGSTHGITSDCTTCTVGGPSLFGQLAGDWRSYLESIPERGYSGGSSGDYAKKHNPAAYFTRIAPQYRSRAVNLAGLTRDLARGTLARFSLVAPNLCHDEHDCGVESGDRWLQTWLPRIFRSRPYRAGTMAVFVTYDEAIGSDNRVYTVVAARSVRPGTVVATPFDHYSMLRTIERSLGLPCLGKACTAPSMARAFRLLRP